MSRKFVRNVTGTKLKGEKIEPFDTNVQNDLLSDETDVYVRQERSNAIEDKYHCLTDDVKEVISNSDLISTENFEHGESKQEDKNKSYINVNKSNKTESEKMESNNHVMTPLQTGYSIEKNNRDVIPNLVKQHETPTEIVSKSERIDVKKVKKNEFELDFDDKDLASKEYIDSKINYKYETLNMLRNVLNLTFTENGDSIQFKIKKFKDEDNNTIVDLLEIVEEFFIINTLGGKGFNFDIIVKTYNKPKNTINNFTASYTNNAYVGNFIIDDIINTDFFNIFFIDILIKDKKDSSLKYVLFRDIPIFTTAEPE